MLLYAKNKNQLYSLDVNHQPDAFQDNGEMQQAQKE